MDALAAVGTVSGPRDNSVGTVDYQALVDHANAQFGYLLRMAARFTN